MQRNWIDSEGNRGRIILFSELPDYVAEKLQERDKSNRMPQDVLKENHLDCLTKKQLEAVTMRFWGDMSVKMVAKRLKITSDAIYRRLRGAYKRLDIEINLY